VGDGYVRTAAFFFIPMEQDDTNFGPEASGTTHCERYLGFIVLGIEFEHVPHVPSLVWFFILVLYPSGTCTTSKIALCVSCWFSFFLFCFAFLGLAPGFGKQLQSLTTKMEDSAEQKIYHLHAQAP